MVTVDSFRQFLEKWNIQDSLTQLAFYNYLTNFCHPDEEISPALINGFFSVALKFTHWQNHRDRLGKEVNWLVSQFDQIPSDHFPFKSVMDLSHLQLFSVDNPSDRIDLVARYLTSQLTDGEQLKVVSDHDGVKVIALILSPGQGLTAITFGPLAVIRKGLLVPLVPLDQLHYTESLELDSTKTQKLELSPFVSAEFQLEDHGLKSCLFRGYTFQKYQEETHSKLSHHPKLFYAVKRIEQHFIKKESDPLYQELINYLEQSIDLVRSDHTEGTGTGQEALSCGRTAIENIFPGDRTLVLLIRNLEDSLSLRANHFENEANY